ncbi:hypothetical protein CEXT_111741 [Caerostris extrusa]|uniref:Uncharacterized protein n=1 Tax=Caerostris extrusa TaxID=172846 RepID=A0AAV4Q2N5_CAEEX|nr:hypothetical protein CEXT_111741 [Caerostris extrusa]
MKSTKIPLFTSFDTELLLTGSISHAASGAPTHLYGPAGMYCGEQKILFQEHSRETSPQGHRNSLSPHPGLVEDFSQMAIVNQISGGRPTLHGKTGVSSRKTPGPRKTLKESGVPDRLELPLDMIPDAAG